MLTQTELSKQIGTGLEQLSAHSCLPEGLMDALQDTSPLYTHLCSLDLPMEKTGGDNNWLWHVFLENTHFTIGSLYLLSGQKIPIHDHPGSCGLLFVMHGELEVTHYLLDASKPGKTVELQILGTERLTRGSLQRFGREENNLHSLHATAPCLILDILTYPYKETERNWYLPIPSLSGQPSERIKAMRMNKR